jgi:hypothetical protein
MMLPFVDPIRTKKQEMHAQRKAVELDQVMFAPAPNTDNSFSHESLSIDLRVSGSAPNRLPNELGCRFAKDDDGRTFGHKADLQWKIL